jgi:gliding motility-associated-like protein
VNPAPVTYLSSPNFYDTTYYITLTVFNECDTSVYTDSVIVRANPKARFAVSSSSGCSPFVIQITNSSLGNPHTYYWDYGNGVRDTTNTSGLSTYTYYTGVVDTFDLMLIAESNCGRDTQIIKIRVAPNVINPGVSINATELYGCVSHAVNFINTTTGATSFNWNFGDGTPITTTNLFQTLVTHVYNTAGTFTVEIDMTNGCSDTSITKEVTVYPAPQASFTAPTTQCQGDTIRFNNLSTQASNYSWSFGNGVVNTLTNPTYVYPAPGVYTVELVAQQSSPQGLVCADSVSQNITIVAKPDTNLITNIGAANCSPFNMVGNTPSYTNETITWYVYDTMLPVYPVVISNPVLNYTFNNSGVFDVVVVIENAAGCKDSTRRTLIVYAKPVAGFSPLNLVTCNLDTLVSYINTTTANNFTPLRYRWFVDGIQRATSGNFTYRYTSLPTDILPRIFNTKLVATNSVGCADSIVGTLQMNPTAKSIFTVNNPNDCIPFNVNIVNSSTYTTVHQWYLNGVLVSTDANPVIQITNPNTDYIIEHVASNQYACKSDTSRFSFRSRVMPKAIFRVSDTLGCNGQLNVVTINNSQNATSYDWDWGDGTTNSTLVNPTHLYTAIGTYRITLTAKDAVCRDTTSKIVKVSQRPTASFVADNTRTCDTAFVRMINLTTNATQYYWMLNNGMTSTAISPVFSLPPSATNYSVTLLAINGDGCRDSLTRANYINVIAPPPGDFTVTPSQVQSIPNYTFGFTNLTPDRVMYNYLWSLGDGTFANTRDVISHQYADTGSYIVQLIVVDTITNCTDTVEKVVRIEGYPGYLYVPNAFYPNSNQIQFRSFKPVGKGLQEYELQIFDSWGKLLFRTTKLDAAGSPVESWDGTFKGAPMPQDAYAWRIKAKYRNGRAWEGMKYDKNENGLPAHTFGTLTLFR